ncbi:MAG: universal stress protein [Roseiflexaceae bacterium]
MRFLVYVGPAPSREAVVGWCARHAGDLASAVTLVSGGGRLDLVRSAAAQIALPGVALEQLALPGNAQQAILTTARRHPYDLVVFGRLNRALTRLLPRPRSKTIAQRLEPSVLRVQGEPRPLRRILLTSGGDETTLANADLVARLARPLGASVTLLHVRSQVSLVFAPPGQEPPAPEVAPELAVLRTAQARLADAGVVAEISVRTGPVLAEVLAELRDGDYDLLVIGAHRTGSALDRILLEDVTGDLLDASPISTLVVKPGGK